MNLKKIFLMILWLFVLQGCTFFECGDGICTEWEMWSACTQDCPNCDDGKICTKDSFNFETQKCENIAISPCCGNDVCEETENFSVCSWDCNNCDDKNSCTLDSFNRETQSCYNHPLTPCCGNGICELNEIGKCSKDCTEKVIAELLLSWSLIKTASWDIISAQDAPILSFPFTWSWETTATWEMILTGSEIVTETWSISQTGSSLKNVLKDFFKK